MDTPVIDEMEQSMDTMREVEDVPTPDPQEETTNPQDAPKMVLRRVCYCLRGEMGTIIPPDIDPNSEQVQTLVKHGAVEWVAP